MRRLPTAITAAAAATAALCAIGAGAPPASAARYRAADAAPTPATVRLLPLGDSITWGQASSTGNGFRGPLAGALTDEGHFPDLVGGTQHGTMADPDNEGHPGWRIDQIAGIADSALRTYRPNVVTLMIGTNDFNQNHQVSTAADRLHALVDRITTDDPGVTVLLASLIVSTNPAVEQYRPAYNAAVPGIAQAEQAAGKHVRFVDMSALTAADLSDSEHPNDGGYQKMADAFNSALQQADAAGWIGTPGPSGVVRSGIAGKCLNDFHAQTANGNPVTVRACNNTNAQWWSRTADNTLRIYGKCLHAANGGTADGTRVQLADCDGTGAQVWQPYEGGYKNPQSGRCLDDPGSSTVDNTQLQLWDCNGTNAQKWTALQPQ
ncbi:Lysophospholipase L1 [Actinacidiphila alni]|uniref:Lysophospholipase L1 n=1 Tax=Actinacidiphila alni TaxID=380248 RepID=A0A1I1XEN2_9ACTN|nr:ricin-type beta-trefoil lectin domain protein [Actinacidiphila alni]SFE05805.1 Lysophospholipase L1 [Actinacidiphila alni]